MEMNDYQNDALKTAIYPERGSNMLYPALGLGGEAGECLEKVKKLWRDKGKTNGRFLTTDEKTTIIKEIGDVLWYCAALSDEIGVRLATVAEINIAKLQLRKEKDMIHGEGDNR